jgi:hypothetical protein
MLGATIRASRDGSRNHAQTALNRKARLMRFICALVAVTLLTTLIAMPRVSAFTMDPASGANSDGSPRFVDPEEQVRSFFFGGSGLNEDGWADRNSVARNAAPQTDGSNQGITFPNLLFPTSPHR